MGFRVLQCGLVSWLSHYLVCDRDRLVTSLNLCFLMCNVDFIIPSHYYYFRFEFLRRLADTR